MSHVNMKAEADRGDFLLYSPEFVLLLPLLFSLFLSFDCRISLALNHAVIFDMNSDESIHTRVMCLGTGHVMHLIQDLV